MIIKNKKLSIGFISKDGKPKGFTLVELLIYMALMGIFLVVLSDIFTATLSTKLKSESVAALDQDARYILSKLSYEIANAESVQLPASGSSGTTLRISTDVGSKTFASASGNLMLTENGVGSSLNGKDTSLTELNFRSVSADGGKPTINFSVTLRSQITANTGQNTKTVNSTVTLRQ
jgi:prepilin-type N-terminal cleavage/methylation domain-containing protein